MVRLLRAVFQAINVFYPADMASCAYEQRMGIETMLPLSGINSDESPLPLQVLQD